PNEANRPIYKAADLVDIYMKDEFDPIISIFALIYFFNHVSINETPVGGIFGPIYSTKSFDKLLEDKFGEKLLKDVLKPVLVPAYDITNNKETYFNNSTYPSFKMRDVIRASTAAPTYFLAKQINNDYYVDGGLFMNNPAYMAYLEAKRIYKQAKYIVCSLGTSFFQSDLSDLKNARDI
ncbi:14078_t:CDS:2, partial [Gigaspora margarita]